MSKQRRGGLGRGLSALIPTAPPAPTEPPVPTAPPALPDPATGLPAGDDRDDRDAAAQPPELGGAVEAGTDLAGEAVPVANPVANPVATFAELPIEAIHANAKQPRQVFDEDALLELAHSIAEFGVLQPVVVRPNRSGAGTSGGNDHAGGSDHAGGNDRAGGNDHAAEYELVMGERRLRAASLAGLSSIPAIVRSTADDAMLRDALLENIHRAQLNPLEEAAAYQQLLEEFGVTHDELAQRIGRSRPQVSNTVRLLNLPIAVQRRVAAGVLSAGHARALLSLTDADQQDDVAARIVAEGLSVRATEELVTLARTAGPPKPVKRAPTRTFVAPAVAELADKLSDVLDTRVRVDLGRRKGRITVEFASIDDLERIVATMAPQLVPHRGSDQP